MNRYAERHDRVRRRVTLLQIDENTQVAALKLPGGFLHQTRLAHAPLGAEKLMGTLVDSRSEQFQVGLPTPEAVTVDPVSQSHLQSGSCHVVLAR